jgi:2-deoxy-D-gluconate 3-dehydrogenase
MSPNLFDLTGTVALVTGAARGLGQALAIGLAEAGADIVGLDREPMSETSGAVLRLGRAFYGLETDLLGLSQALAHELVQLAVDNAGRLDILVNNAGIIRRAPAIKFPQDDWQAVLQINLSSVFYLSQAAAQHFTAVAQGGKIINMASMLSFQGGVNVPAYTAAKSGVAGLTRALANEWARHGINVNAIAPGYMATEVTAALRADPARSQAILSRIPAGRWGEPEDLKGVVVFLASPAAAYLHGAIIPVDGGWLSW